MHPFIIFSWFFLLAVSCQPQVNTEEQELRKVEAEIIRLTEELSDYRKASYDETMESQRDMIAEWHQFAEDIEDAELEDKKAEEIESRIKVLIQRRD